MGYGRHRRSFKKSSRPRRLGIALTILVLLPLLAGSTLHVYGRVRFAHAVSELEALVGQPLDFDLTGFRTSPPPEQHNMATWLAEGAAAMEPWSYEEVAAQNEALGIARDAWSPQLEAEVRAMVRRHGEALDVLHNAAPLSLSDYGLAYDEMIASGNGSPNMLDLLRAGKLLSLEARLAFGDGNTAAGLPATQTLSRLASSFANERFIIHSLLAVACEGYLLVVAREVLESREPWAESPALIGQIESLLLTEDMREDMRDSLAVEALWMFHRIREEPREGSFRPRLSRPARYSLEPLIMAESIEITRRAVEQIPLPFAQAHGRIIDVHPTSGFVLRGTSPRLLDLFTFAGEGDLGAIDLAGRYISALSGEESPTKSYEINLLAAVYKIQRRAGLRQLVRAGITMRRIGLTDGDYPRQRPKLAVLDKPDPFAGRPIVYQLRDDGSLVLEIENGQELSRQLFAYRDLPDEERLNVILPPKDRLHGLEH